MSKLKLIILPLLVLPSLALAAPEKKNSFNGKEPIEITSDALEVQQVENIAIFTGNVVAIQNDVRLKSDKMIVHYASKEEKQAAPEKQTVKKIDVEGNVFLATPEETASGDRGDYNVEAEEIHLWENVVLTRGANVLKGNQLTYNFASGKSVVTGGAGQGKQRVRALFIPEKK